MALTGDDILLVERDGASHVATITLNREERANAMSIELCERLAATWPTVRDDDTIRVVVLTGAGSRFFSAGNDLKDTAALGADFAATLASRDLRVAPADHGCWKPVIAAVNGAAVAGGFFLAQMCDVRIAAPHATFAIPEARWALPAPFAADAQYQLPAAVVREMVLFGRTVPAARMHELGFLNAVVPADQLVAEARAWAAQLCELVPSAVQAHKQLLHRALATQRARIDQWSAEFLDPLIGSPEQQASVQRFGR